MNARISDASNLDHVLGVSAGSSLDAGPRHWDYHLAGNPADGVVLLVAGLGMHRIEWSPELLARLRERGLATLCLDNRDAGLSRHPLGAATAADSQSPYSLRDLAADLADFLEIADLAPVHVVGISMGGMIAQHLALLAPERVATLSILMSSSGARGVGRPHEGAKWIFRTPAPTESLESYVDYAVRHHLSITAPGYEDADRARWMARAVWARGVDPQGTARQLAAIGADGDRTERLADIALPTLVIHGDADPMIDIDGGRALAAAIPGADFQAIPGMGHAIPWQLADGIADAIWRHAARTSR